MKVLIIGGGTSGTEVAWRLRQQNKELEILILEKGSHLQYSPCSLPYLIGGEIEKADDVFLFDSGFYDFNNIKIELNAEVKKIDRKKKCVFYEKEGKENIADYDRLVISVGAKLKIPPISGLNSVKYFVLKSIDDAKKIQAEIKPGEKAAIIGSGYIGVELADALRVKGLEVYLLEAQDWIMPGTFDREIAEKIKAYIEDGSVEIITDALIENVEEKSIKIKEHNIPFDRLFICAGLEADIKLALEAGLECDEGIKVDEQGATSDKSIYACGDSVMSIQSFDKKKIFCRLATTAVRQAAVIAENIAGTDRKNEVVTSASVSKFGNLIFGSCGVNAEYCKQNKIKIVSAVYNGQTKSEHYPGAQDIFIKLLASETGKIIGCQIAGFEDVAGRINLISLAIKKEMSLDEFINLETCYNPAVAPIFDPLVLAAQICLKKINARQ